LIFFYLGFGAILLAFLHMPAPTGLFKTPAWVIAWIGRRSYSIYLWHIPIQYLGIEWIRGHFPGALSSNEEIAIYLAGSILIGAILYEAVEAPAMRFRDRYFPAPSSIA
jgi:peptidoglycan/LPS O-acetylase OafA/YrhL